MFSLIERFLNSQPSSDPEHEVRLAAASLLIAMTRADSRVEDVESETVMAALGKLLNLKAAKLEELVQEAQRSVDDSVSLHDYTQILHRQQGREDKRTLVRMLWAVAYADGQIDPHEELLVRKVAGLLYLDQQDFIEAKREALAQHQTS